MVNAKRFTRGTAVLMAATLALALCALCTALAPQKAWASGIDQTAATENSVTVSWTDPYGDNNLYTTNSYTISWGTSYDKLGTKVQLGADAKSYTITGLKPGTKYYVRVDYNYTSTYTGTAFDSCMTCPDIATRVGIPTGVKQTTWWRYINKVEFGWNVQDAADKVEWKVCKASNGKLFKKGSSNYARSKTFDVNKVKNNVVYTVQMRVHDKWGWSGWSKKAYLFTQPEVNGKKTKVNGNKLTVTWAKTNGATGYDVYVSLKKNKGYKKVATVKASKNTVTVKKLGKAKINPKKKYYVYVVAKKKVGKVTYDSGRNYTWEVKKGRQAFETYIN